MTTTMERWIGTKLADDTLRGNPEESAVHKKLKGALKGRALKLGYIIEESWTSANKLQALKSMLDTTFTIYKDFIQQHYDNP